MPGTHSADTSPAARRRQLDGYRSMAPADRLRLADAMSREVQELARAGIRRRHPDRSDEEQAAALEDLVLGRDFASEVRGRRQPAGRP